jgi:hypothetical protein
MYQETCKVSIFLFLTPGSFRVLRDRLTPTPFIHSFCNHNRLVILEQAQALNSNAICWKLFLFSYDKLVLISYDRDRGAAREMWHSFVAGGAQQLNCVHLHSDRGDFQTEPTVYFRTKQSDACFVRYLSTLYQPLRCQMR